jgi:hypothetical protein
MNRYQKGEAHPITNHKFDVTDMLSIEEKTGEIYYLATNGDPKQRHLFKYNHEKNKNDHN